MLQSQISKTKKPFQSPSLPKKIRGDVGSGFRCLRLASRAQHAIVGKGRHCTELLCDGVVSECGAARSTQPQQENHRVRE